MRIGTVRFFVASVASLLLCHTACFARRSNSTPHAMQPTFQELIESKFKAGSISEAWVMYSESGMEDAGQMAMTRDSNLKSLVFLATETNGQAVSVTRALTPNEEKAWLKTFGEAAKLKDFNGPAFGGINYTYIHYQATAATAFVKKQRTHMNNPTKKYGPDHLRLIDAFKALKRTISQETQK